MKRVFQNGGGITLTKQEYQLILSFIHLWFDNCNFQNNVKLGSGGAVQIYYFAYSTSEPSESKFIMIRNSIFSENKVNRLGSANAQGGAIGIQGQVTGNGCLKLHIHIENSTFTNNKAVDGGGALYISDQCLSTTIKNSTFVITDQTFDSPKGAFILSYSDISIDQSVFVRELKKLSPSLLELEMLSEAAVIHDLNIRLHCYEWHNLTIKIKVIQQQAKEIQIACSACPASFYIPSDGNFLVSYQADHENLLVEGTATNAENPVCTPCPVGADCPGNDLNGMPNYWGTNTDNVINMYGCPADYCCTENCTGYDKCSGHRTGVLCGSCQEHYSLSLSMLSADCIEAETCDSYWLWPLIILAAVGYMMWYTFKGDILSIPFIIIHKIRKKGPKPPSDQDDDDDVDKGFFGIVTYFIQIKAAMQIPLSLDHTRIIDEIFRQIETYVAVALNFELSSTSNDVCALRDLTTTKKMMFKLLFLFGIFFSWCVAYLSLFLIQKLLSKVQLCFGWLQKFNLKLIASLIEIMKYTYLGFSAIVFYCLTCTNVAEDNVWYYDGSVKCYSRWQIVMIIFGVSYILPFPFLVYFAMKLLDNKKISRKSFFLATCFPLPILLYWLNVSRKQNVVEDQETADKKITRGR